MKTFLSLVRVIISFDSVLFICLLQGACWFTVSMHVLMISEVYCSRLKFVEMRFDYSKCQPMKI